MSTTLNSSVATAESPGITLQAAFADLVTAALVYVAQKVDAGADNLGDQVENLASTGDAAQQAGYQGIKAGLRGDHPVWAAAKSAWAGASGKVRLAAVLIVVLVLLTGPLVLVLLLLGLLIAAIVAAVRAARGD